MKLTQEQIERIRSLEDQNGRITPEQVVDDAKDKRSPLHALFTWDKNKAAAAYWLEEARQILGAVRVLVTNETTTARVPVYMRDPDAHGAQGYRSVSALRANPDQARESLIYTLEVASGHLRRALDLAGPLGMSGEIDALIDQVIGVQRSLKAAA